MDTDDFKDWIVNFPNIKDAGKQVTLMMPHKNILGQPDRFITGELYIDDWQFNGEDEVPLFRVKSLIDVAFTDCEKSKG